MDKHIKKNYKILNKLLISLTLEEIALADFINAETLNVQKVGDGNFLAEDINNYHQLLASIISSCLKTQLVLHLKLENILEMSRINSE